MRVLGMRVSGAFSKLLEVAGAGLASAIGAFLLSQMVSKPAPTAPASQLVQIAPADAQMLGIMHSDQAALLAELQKVVGPQAAAAPASAPAAKAERPKPVKTAQPVPLPRQPKVEPRPASYKAAAEEPLPIQPISAVAPARRAAFPAVVTETDARAADAGSAGGRFRVFSALKQIPSWFVPDSDKVFGDAPRPPAPVGQFVSSAM